MTHKSYKKSFAFFAIAIFLFSGAVFVLGGYGQSGPDAAPNLSEYGLVGYWNMEEGKGQTVYDRSGNANNGTLGANSSVAKDDPVFTSGYSSSGAGGTGLKFDGKDDYVWLGNPSILRPTSGNLSIASWFKKSITAGAMQIVKARLYGYSLAYNDNSLWYTVWNTVSLFSTVNTSGFDDNGWHYAVGVLDNTTIRIYVDGIEKSSSARTAAGIYHGAGGIAIGRDGDANVQFFSGTIDEVRIYNRALSADEIRQHYNQKKPILEWKFDEGSGTTTRDESFNNNDGTLHE